MFAIVCHIVPSPFLLTSYGTSEINSSILFAREWMLHCPRPHFFPDGSARIVYRMWFGIQPTFVKGHVYKTKGVGCIWIATEINSLNFWVLHIPFDEMPSCTSQDWRINGTRSMGKDVSYITSRSCDTCVILGQHREVDFKHFQTNSYSRSVMLWSCQFKRKKMQPVFSNGSVHFGL